MNDNRRVGEDFVLSLPKDVGACIMLLPPDQRDAMLEIVERRVDQVMGMIEADVETRVRKDGAFENRPGDGLAYAGSCTPPRGRWTASRPIRIPTGTCSSSTRRVTRSRAADQGGGFRQHLPRPAVLRGRVLLAGGGRFRRMPACRSSGGPTANGAWPGCNRWAATFSKRTGEIEDEARRLDITDAGRKSKLGAKTRSKKDKELMPGGAA